MIKKFGFKYKFSILYSIFLILSISILELGQSFLLQTIIDSPSLKILTKSVIIVIGFLVLYLLINFLQTNSVNKIRYKFRNYYNTSLFKYYSNLPLKDNFELGVMINSFISESQIITEKYLSSILNSFHFLSSLILGSIYILKTNLILGFFLYVVAFIPLIVNRLFAKHISLKQKKVLQEQSKWISWLNMFFMNRVNISISGYKDSMIEQTTIKSDILNKRQYNLEFIYGVLKSINNLFSKIMFLFLVIIGIYFVINKKMTMGSLIAITQASNMIISPISNFIDVKNNLVASKEILKGCNEKEVLLSKYIKELGVIPKLNEDIYSIKFKDLCISFGEKELIRNTNFEVKQGKKYLIIGESGSGKSSLLNVLLKKICVENDKVIINGHDINSINYFEEIAYVSQTNSLFPFNLKNNIVLGNTYNEDRYVRIINLCRLTHLENSFVFDVDNVTLSGGEIQRINIARMLYSNKNLILLDEAFSALDDSNQRRIQKDILLNENLTVLSVEHKILPEMIEYFDYKIEVIDQSIKFSSISH